MFVIAVRRFCEQILSSFNKINKFARALKPHPVWQIEGNHNVCCISSFLIIEPKRSIIELRWIQPIERINFAETADDHRHASVQFCLSANIRRGCCRVRFSGYLYMGVS